MSGPGSPSADSAGVRFPPPLIYVASFGLALAAGRVGPVPVARAPLFAAAVVCASLGFVLVSWSFMSFRIAKTTPFPHRASNALVTTGPFRRSRNPMYLSLALLQLGAAIAVNSLWAILSVPVSIIAVDRFVVPLEERYLERKFGDAYRSYRGRVRRWL